MLNPFYPSTFFGPVPPPLCVVVNKQVRPITKTVQGAAGLTPELKQLAEKHWRDLTDTKMHRKLKRQRR